MRTMISNHWFEKLIVGLSFSFLPKFRCLTIWNPFFDRKISKAISSMPQTCNAIHFLVTTLKQRAEVYKMHLSYQLSGLSCRLAKIHKITIFSNVVTVVKINLHINKKMNISYMLVFTLALVKRNW